MLVDVGNRKVGIWIQHDRRGLSGNFNEDRKQIQPCTKATVEIDGVNYHGIARRVWNNKYEHFNPC
jgi:hypothetical protein